MLLQVNVRAAPAGDFRRATAWTGGDAPDGETAIVMRHGSPVFASTDVLVAVRPSTGLDEVIDLMNAGYPVVVSSTLTRARGRG